MTSKSKWKRTALKRSNSWSYARVAPTMEDCLALKNQCPDECNNHPCRREIHRRNNRKRCDMAWYNINYACRHSGREQIYGKSSYRDGLLPRNLRSFALSAGKQSKIGCTKKSLKSQSYCPGIRSACLRGHREAGALRDHPQAED